MGIVLIPLSQEKYASIDLRDADLSDFTWCMHDRGYATRTLTHHGKQHGILLHRVILERKLGRPPLTTEICEFLDGNLLNCQRDNLAYRDRSLRAQRNKLQKNNTSGYRGVVRHQGKWRAQIVYKRQQYHLDSYDTPEEAARAYDRAALHYFGSQAKLNDV